MYEVCGWEPWYATSGSQISNMFRISADVKTWHDVFESTHLMHQLSRFSRPGGWAHPDMLIGSSPGAVFTLTPFESRAQFTLWSIFPAPLMLGLNVRNASEWDIATYTNPEVIAVNQDKTQHLAMRVFSNCGYYPEITLAEDGYSLFSVRHQEHETPAPWNGGQPFQILSAKEDSKLQCQQVWARQLENGDVALAAVNFGDEAAELEISQSDLPFNQSAEPLPNASARNASARHLAVRDLWKRESMPNISGALVKLSLPAKAGCLMLRLSPKDKHPEHLAPQSLLSTSDPVFRGNAQPVKPHSRWLYTVEANAAR